MEPVTSSTARAHHRWLPALAILTITALAVLPGPTRTTTTTAAAHPAEAGPVFPPPAGVDDRAEAMQLRHTARRGRPAPPPPVVAVAETAVAVTVAAPRHAAQVASPARVARAARVPTPRPAPPRIRHANIQPPVTGDAGRAAAAVAYALAQVGKRYVWATAGPNTFDCSGLVQAAFARIGVALPHQSGGIAGRGRYIPRSQWQPGDVLIYPGHVAIYLGGGRMVHAANPRKGVLIASVYGSPTGRRLV